MRETGRSAQHNTSVVMLYPYVCSRGFSMSIKLCAPGLAVMCIGVSVITFAFCWTNMS